LVKFELTHATQLKLLKSLQIQTAGNCIEKSMPITNKAHFSDFEYSTTKKTLVLPKTFVRVTVE
jgi:hypothetical protein